MKSSPILIFLFLLVSTPFISAGFGYDNPELPQLIEEKFDGRSSSFYMPNNKSVFGNFSFNGGFLNDGFSIIDGDIYAQQGFFLNISSLNVTRQNLTVLDDFQINGSVIILENLTVGTNTLFVDSVHNMVGIGTASPNSILEIAPGASTDGFILFNADNGWNVGYDATGNGFAINDGATSRFFIDDTSGNVGLGTSSPTVDFEIRRDTGSPTILLDGGNDAILILDKGGVTRVANIELRSGGNSKWKFGLADSNSLGVTGDEFWIGKNTADSKFLITQAGKVGIGTTTPSTLFHTFSTGAANTLTVNTIQADGSSNRNEIVPMLDLYHSAGGSAGIAAGGSSIIFTSDDDVPAKTTFAEFQMIVNSAAAAGKDGIFAWKLMLDGTLSEKMRLDHNGKLGIGTTAPTTILTLGGTTPTISVDTADASDNKSLTITGAGAVAGSRGAFITLYGNEHATFPAELRLTSGDFSGIGEKITFWTNGGQQMTLLTNAGGTGDLGIGTPKPNSTLDIFGAKTKTIGTPFGDGKWHLKIFDTTSASTGSTGGSIIFGGFRSGTSGVESPLGAIDTTLRLAGSEGGSLRFFTADTGGSLVQRMIINDTGNVGIGTSNPDNLLHIFMGDSGGTAESNAGLVVEDSNTAGIQILSGTSSNSFIAFGDSGDNDIGFIQYRHDSDSMRFATNASVKMTINASGRVGIGTTVPSALLELNGSDEFSLSFTNTGAEKMNINFDSNRVGSDNSIGRIRAFWNGTRIAGIDLITGPDAVNKDDGQITFSTAPPGGGFVEAMRIDENGFVGIGITTPARPLSVFGNVAGIIVDLNPDGANDAFINFNAANAWQLGYDQGLGGFRLKDNTVTRLFVDDTTGNIGIGTDSPATLLHMNGTGNTELRITAGEGRNATITLQADESDNSGDDWTILVDQSENLLFQSDNTGTTTFLSLASSGEVGIAGSGNRPLAIDGGTGGMTFQGETGGWSFKYGFLGSAATDRGGFGLQGNGDAAQYYWIGASQTSDEFVLNATTSFVGIGTRNPQQTLNVVGDFNLTGDFILGGNFTLPDGGIIWGNATCVFISSPAGTGRLDVCD